METRVTARVLLFDPDDRLLLVKVDDPRVSDPSMPWLKSPFWVTPGGRVEPGEIISEAAAREIHEETGLMDVSVGPAVWYGEQVLRLDGREVLLKETFVVARAQSASLSQERWTAEEKSFLKEMRYWRVEDIESTFETILPPVLKKLIRGVVGVVRERGGAIRSINLGED